VDGPSLKLWMGDGIAITDHVEADPMFDRMWRFVIDRFLDREKMPWYWWMRSGDGKRYYVLNRTRFVRRIGEDGFSDFVLMLEEIAGKWKSRGLLVYHKPESVLAAYEFEGRSDRIARSKIATVSHGIGKVAIVEVQATHEEARRVAKKILEAYRGI